MGSFLYSKKRLTVEKLIKAIYADLGSGADIDLQACRDLRLTCKNVLEQGLDREIASEYLKRCINQTKTVCRFVGILSLFFYSCTMTVVPAEQFS